MTEAWISRHGKRRVPPSKLRGKNAVAWARDPRRMSWHIPPSKRRGVREDVRLVHHQLARVFAHVHCAR